MVLIVDDAHVMRLVIKDLLIKKCGYTKEQVREASGGKEAIALYKRKKPQLVLCDVSMLDMNGPEVVKALIELDPEAKIIMCTSSGAAKDVQKCMNAGAVDYVVKPPDTNRLLDAIDKALGRTADASEASEPMEATADTDAADAALAAVDEVVG